MKKWLASLGAAVGDVAVARAVLFADRGYAVYGVERVHVEAGSANHEAWTDEAVFAVVIAQDVADVLAQEALDALAELLDAIHVALHHAVVTGLAGVAVRFRPTGLPGLAGPANSRSKPSSSSPSTA